MNSKHRSHKPGMREVSQRQARGNADQAGETRKSHRPGVEDDSEIVQSLVATLGAPVEGALDSMHERERAAEEVRTRDRTRSAAFPVSVQPTCLASKKARTDNCAAKCRPSPRTLRQNRARLRRTCRAIAPAPSDSR